MTRGGWTWLGAAIAILLALPAVAPLANPGVPSTYDLPFHVARMVELRAATTTGEAFPRWVQPFAAGLGFPFFNFYPPLAYYVATALTVAGLSVFAAYELAAALAILLASVAMYAWMAGLLREAGASNMRLCCSALGASAAYVYAPYFLTDVYRRGALPESLGLALLPLMFLFFERLLRRPGLKSVPPAAVSVAALVMAHNVVSVLGIALLALYAGCSALAVKLVHRTSGRNVSVQPMVFYAAVAVGLGLGMAAFVWLPLLVERSYLSGTFQFLQSGLFDTRARLADSWPPLQFSPLYDYGEMYDDWGQLYRAGLIQLLAALIGLGSLVHLRHWKDASRTREVGMIVPALFFAATTLALLSSLSPLFEFAWRAPILSSFQFPWRVQGTVALGTSFLTGAGLFWLGGRWPRALPMMLMIVVVSLTVSSLPGLPRDTVVHPRLTLGDVHKYTSLAGWSPPEELPLPQLSVEDASGLSSLLNVEQGSGFVRLSLEASRATTLALHTLYFPGWRVYVDGREVPAFALSSRGLLGFEVPEGTHDVLARFEVTPLRWWAQAIAVLSAFALLVVVIICFARRQWPVMATGLMVALVIIYLGVRFSGVPSGREEFHSLDLPATNGVRLMGVGVDRAGKGVLEVSLYWHALRRLDDLESFVAVLDGRGHAVGNPMRRPMDGVYPTSQWQIGEIVVDTVEIELTSEIDVSDLSIAAGLRPFHPTGSSSPVVSYRAPLASARTAKLQRQPEVVVDGVLALESHNLSDVAVAPGENLTVGLDWSALGIVGGDVVTYLHLISADGQLVAQFDGPPGPPGLPVVLWVEGELVHEARTLQVAKGAPPGRYSLRLGAYRYPNMEPLPLTLEGRRVSGGNVSLASVFVVRDDSRPAVVRASNALNAMFAGQLALLGFDLSSNTVRPEESLVLTTYWRSLEEVALDYTIFAQVLDGSGAVRWQKDGEPAEGSYPTSIWKPGEYVVDRRVLAVDSGAARGDYRLVVGLYHWPDVRPLSVAVDGKEAGNALDLGIVNVLPADR